MSEPIEPGRPALDGRCIADDARVFDEYVHLRLHAARPRPSPFRIYGGGRVTPLSRTAPPAIQRRRLMTVTVAQIANGGVASVTSRRIGKAAGLDAQTVVRRTGGMRRLVLLTTRELSADPQLPRAADTPGPPVRDARELLDDLTAAHTRYIEVAPLRFAALLQVMSAAMVGHEDLVVPLCDRRRRTVATCLEHFELLRERGLADPCANLFAAAEMFVHGINGIAMIHQIDLNDGRRDEAYAELCTTVELRLTAPRGR